MAALPDTAETAGDDRLAFTGNPLAAELAALRGVAAQNMRLLKAQILPLIDAALRASAAGQDADAADRNRRWTDSALRLIDDTMIAAAAGAVAEAVSPVDLRDLLRCAADRHGNRIGPVTLGALPRLLAREPHLRLLADEVMAAVARAALHDLPGGLRVGWTPAGDGAAIVWFQERAMPLPGPEAAGFAAARPGERRWSVCQNLMARMGGGLHLARTGRGRLCLSLRFPAQMVLPEQAR